MAERRFNSSAKEKVTAMDTNAGRGVNELPDAVAAAAFRRLVHHLQHRHDAQNIDLMGLSGFCRNCLADWIMEAGFEGDKAAAREVIHGMPQAEWKANAISWKETSTL